MIPKAFAPGIEAVRQSLRPFLLIQAMTAGAVVLYYTSSAFRDATAGIQAFKGQAGLLFPILTTVLASTALPEFAKWITRQPNTSFADLSFMAVFFGLIGAYVDLLYRGSAVLFGTANDFPTILKKVMFDMLVNAPLFSIPFGVIAFGLKEREFSLPRFREWARSGELVPHYFSVLLMAWAFWTPVVTAVYAMPSLLQFVLYLFAQGAWSLLFIQVTGAEKLRARTA